MFQKNDDDQDHLASYTINAQQADSYDLCINYPPALARETKVSVLLAQQIHLIIAKLPGTLITDQLIARAA